MRIDDLQVCPWLLMRPGWVPGSMSGTMPLHLHLRLEMQLLRAHPLLEKSPLSP